MEVSEWLVELGKLIKAARESAGFDTHVEFAIAVDVAGSTLSNWENGKGDGIGIANLIAVARVTGEPLEFFMPPSPNSEDSIWCRARDLGAILKKRRLERLLEMPEKHLLKEIDAIWGAYSAKAGPHPDEK